MACFVAPIKHVLRLAGNCSFPTPASTPSESSENEISISLTPRAKSTLHELMDPPANTCQLQDCLFEYGTNDIPRH